MIDIESYRARIGCFCNRGKVSPRPRGDWAARGQYDSELLDQAGLTSPRFVLFIYGLFLVFYIIFISMVIYSFTLSDFQSDSTFLERPRILPNYRGWDLPIPTKDGLDVWYFYMIAYLMKCIIVRFSNDDSSRSGGGILKIVFGSKFHKPSRNESSFRTFLVYCIKLVYISLAFISLVCFLLIAMVNPSMKIPAPKIYLFIIRMSKDWFHFLSWERTIQFSTLLKSFSLIHSLLMINLT